MTYKKSTIKHLEHLHEQIVIYALKNGIRICDHGRYMVKKPSNCQWIG